MKRIFIAIFVFSNATTLSATTNSSCKSIFVENSTAFVNGLHEESAFSRWGFFSEARILKNLYHPMIDQALVQAMQDQGLDREHQLKFITSRLARWANEEILMLESDRSSDEFTIKIQNEVKNLSYRAVVDIYKKFIKEAELLL